MKPEENRWPLGAGSQCFSVRGGRHILSGCHAAARVAVPTTASPERPPQPVVGGNTAAGRPLLKSGSHPVNVFLRSPAHLKSRSSGAVAPGCFFFEVADRELTHGPWSPKSASILKPVLNASFCILHSVFCVLGVTPTSGPR